MKTMEGIGLTAGLHWTRIPNEKDLWRTRDVTQGKDWDAFGAGLGKLKKTKFYYKTCLESMNRALATITR